MDLVRYRFACTEAYLSAWTIHRGPIPMVAAFSVLGLCAPYALELLVETSTRAGLGFRAGVKDYRLTYFMDDYKVIDTDLLAAFRVVPQPGVPPEEAGAAIAAESDSRHCGRCGSRTYAYLLLC